MTHTSQITRQHPTAFVFLIDQSGSMEEKVRFGGEIMSKADAVAMVCNMLLEELQNRSSREEGLRDYFDVCALGYSGAGVVPLLDPSGDFISISRLAALDPPRRLITKRRDNTGGFARISTTEQRYWIEPRAEGGTPMFQAFVVAYGLVSRWCKNPANKASYPITVFNITDGEGTDASSDKLLDITSRIQELRTDDGRVLVINIHISSHEGTDPVIFPSSIRELPENKHARLLYDMSSEVPLCYNNSICEIKDAVPGTMFRGMSFNTSITDLITLMNIGSMSANLM